MTSLLLGILADFMSTTLVLPEARVPSYQQRPARQISWQKPFQYEAKVYASSCPYLPSNCTSYFDTAQMLWHIQPQDVENMYPLLHHKATVNVPSTIRSGLDLKQELYVRIFIQKADQFSPHPNLSDPRLVSLSIPLMSWKGSSLDKTIVDVSTTHMEDAVPELTCVTSASWAIVLENQPHNLLGSLGYNLAPHKPALANFYNPLLLRNHFTQSLPKVQSSVALKGNAVETGAYPLTIDVDLELSGIRLGWMLARARLDELISPVREYAVVKKRIPAPWNPRETAVVEQIELVETDGPIPLGAVRRLSAPLVFAFVLSRALMDAELAVFTLMLLYLLAKPASRWAGVSRTTVAALFLGYIAHAISRMCNFGACMPWHMLDLVPIYILANVDDMSFASLVVPSWVIRNISWFKPSSVQQQAAVATEKADNDSTVVDIRRSVDVVAMYWLNMLSVLAVAMGAAYMTLRQLGYFSSQSSICGLLTTRAVFARRFAWLPQIAVNYKTKSGSLAPIAFIIYPLIRSVLATSIYHLSGYDGYRPVTAYSFPTYLCYAVMLWQWIVYRKVKQD
ncbi:hypothetical protein GGI20_003742 [Coemansia sp. BCRC 34301]|nr:hypothetical protein GGI20_003742 [Coemansia sp. BCRC 34301]